MNPWMIIAALLTLLVLSRIAGDNPIFRFSQYLFVGVSLGFSALVIWGQVASFWQPEFANQTTNQVLTIVPVVLGLLLFTRLGGQRLSWLANMPLGILFGVGAALAIAGALLGTLFPQVRGVLAADTAGADPAAQIGRVLLLISVILILFSFTYTGRSKSPLSPIRQLAGGTGRWLLIGSLGAFFAGAMLTYLTVLVERVQFLAGLF